MLKKLRKFFTHKRIDATTRIFLVVFAVGLGASLWWGQKEIEIRDSNYESMKQEFQQQLTSTESELDELKQQDQYKINQELRDKVAKTEEAFSEVAYVFDNRADMAEQGYDVSEVDKELSVMLSHLSKLEYDQAIKKAGELTTKMNEQVAAAVEVANPAPQVAISNDYPGAGYSRQTVTTERGNFTVAMVVANSPTVVIDTASDSDCANDCPTLPLQEYVARNGGFAGINGGYFCPADYASCQGKVNSFDTLVFNGRTKTAFNTENNVYSTVPLIAAYGTSLNFYSRTLDWGVDTGSTGALANYPLMLSGSNISFDEGSLPSYLKDTKGTRGFIAKRGSDTIVGHVFGATVMDAAYALKELGVEYALNLDGGGSSALYYQGGYKVGPGRSLPVAVVLK